MSKKSRRARANQMDLTTSIMSKWRAQGHFIRFIDGNVANCSVRNLCYVSLKDAMEHIDEWKVDWDMNLTADEVALVHRPSWRSLLVCF